PRRKDQLHLLLAGLPLRRLLALLSRCRLLGLRGGGGRLRRLGGGRFMLFGRLRFLLLLWGWCWCRGGRLILRRCRQTGRNRKRDRQRHSQGDDLGQSERPARRLRRRGPIGHEMQSLVNAAARKSTRFAMDVGSTWYRPAISPRPPSG